MGNIVMREEEMEVAVSGLDKCYIDTESAGKNIPNKFSNVARTGLFDLGISTIKSQINGITTSIFNVKNIVKKHSGEMFNMDRQMATIADGIEIPQDFVKNDSKGVNAFNQIILDKIDGKSVNTGQNTTQVDETFNSTVTAETLQNISNNQTLKEERLDDKTAINKQNISSINNEKTLEEQKLNDATKIANQSLSDINNNQELKEARLDEATRIAKETLNNISKTQELSKAKIDENSTIRSKVLNNINNLKNMTAQNLDDSVNIVKDALSSINNETKAATGPIGNSFENKIETIAQDIANKINQDRNETNG